MEVSGRLAGGTLLVEQMALLVPAARATTVYPLEEAKVRSELHKPRLKIRSEVVAAVRDFFVGNGFLEVETPTLARTPAHERHILPFQTEARGANQGERFLVASPEHHMKRLLARGLERIFQIGRCFRNDESTSLHLPEFTMVEWYRAYSTYPDIAEDTGGKHNFISQAYDMEGTFLEDLVESVREEFKENEDLPNTTNPDDWARISGRKGERIINVRTLITGISRKEQSIENISSGQYL